MEISVLKQDRLCAISGNKGQIDKAIDKNYGIYFNDMRLLSRLSVDIDGYDLKLVSAQEDCYYKQSFYYEVSEHITMKKERMVGELFAERYTIYNYDQQPVSLSVKVDVETDFFDMFEVRGGISGVTKLIKKEESSHNIKYAYKGLDGNDYHTYVTCSEDFSGGGFHVTISPQNLAQFELTVGPKKGFARFDILQEDLEKQIHSFNHQSGKIHTDNDKLNQIMATSLNDLQVLTTELDGYDYYCAGVPFFMALFGRDGLIAGLYSTMVNLEVVKSMLYLYAKYQGTKVNEAMEEEPGKILHELRISEMPAAGINEFGRYYGTSDATPLYLMLAIKYYRQTNDAATIKDLRKPILAALNWLECYGTGDNGYVQYTKKSDGGNMIHGWRDSPGGVRDSRGEFPPYPHSLCEFQSYTYYVYNQIADILDVLGERESKDRVRIKAASLKESFNKDFWMEDQKFFAQGLNGNNDHIDSIASDVGHLLFSDIIDEDKKPYVLDKLYSDSLYTGYGIRTFAKESINYNPMSYHGGSVWPHDTAFILMGMADEDEAKFIDITKGLLSTADSLAQMPELFCGYDKTETAEVVPFPTACRPQAWSCATPFILMEKLLGISYSNGTVMIQPKKQDLFNYCRVEDMPLGNGIITFEVTGTRVEILANTSGFDIKEAL